MQRKIISAKQIVEKYNLAYHTLNYYTAIGLLRVLNKIGNERMYDETEIKKRLAKISKLSKEGYPLYLIRKKIAGF